jgi:hypothetical protein
MIFLDTETCGFVGPAVLLQYAKDDEEIILHEIWRETVASTLSVIEEIVNHPGGIVGFNLTFDWFQICKIYSMLSMLPDKDSYPDEQIEELAEYEPLARDGDCLKPVRAMDLMLHARKGPYQSMMRRDEVRIRRVPTALAWHLAQELERRVQLKDIYFAKKKNKWAPRWNVFDIEDAEGDIVPDFKDVVLTFAPSSALKTLAADALGLQPDLVTFFQDIDIDSKFHPVELGYAPFARAIGSRHNWKGAWPDVIEHHIDHWGFNTYARKYAANDVDITRKLYRYFGSPELGDDDSELACMVGAVRWKGFAIDVEGIKRLRQSALDKKKAYPTAPGPAMRYVTEKMHPTEILAMKGSTKKVVLEEVASLTEQDCEDCIDMPVGYPCAICKGTGRVPHPAAERARNVLDARGAGKELELYDKLLQAGRFHASFVIIGTKSSRMSGTDQLNAQGIKRTKEVRRCFPLAFSGMQLSGGDFAGFEVVLADAAYNDIDLRNDLLSGKKIHALFGQYLFPGKTYEDIVASAGDRELDMYDMSKRGVFALIYGGDHNTLHSRIGIPVEIAEAAYQRFVGRYHGVGLARQKIFTAFCSMTQPNGIGSRVIWADPAEYIESLMGFRRYFTVENMICKALFDLGEHPPKHWKEINTKVVRRDREQLVGGATQTALFGAAFGLQGNNMRAAANHVIQSSGAQITKAVQRQIWELQPSGIHPWRVIPMNIHDEIMCPTDPDYVNQVEKIVYDAVETFRPKVPLIKMEWNPFMKNWSEK